MIPDVASIGGKRSSSFLKERTKKLLFFGYTLSDRTATATKKSFASFLQKRRPCVRPRAGAAIQCGSDALNCANTCLKRVSPRIGSRRISESSSGKNKIGGAVPAPPNLPSLLLCAPLHKCGIGLKDPVARIALGRCGDSGRTHTTSKSFLLLFFKKEGLPSFASVLKSKPAFPDRLCVRPTSLSRAERLLRFGHDDAHAILFPHRASADAPAEILAV